MQGEFRYQEIGQGLLAEWRGWLSLAGGVLSESLLVGLMVALILRLPVPSDFRQQRKIVERRVTPLVAPKRETPKEAFPASTPPFRVVGLPVIFPREPTPVTHSDSRVRYRLDPDRGQHFAFVIEKHSASVGFADEGILKYRFAAPGWHPIQVPDEGVSVRSFYYFLLDETTGRYTFLDDLRGRYRELASMKPYALFGFEIQNEIENLVRRAAVGKCAPTDDLQAILKVEVETDFRVERVECVPKQIGSRDE
jgi:hypothetical protein